MSRWVSFCSVKISICSAPRKMPPLLYRKGFAYPTQNAFTNMYTVFLVQVTVTGAATLCLCFQRNIEGSCLLHMQWLLLMKTLHTHHNLAAVALPCS